MARAQLSRKKAKKVPTKTKTLNLGGSKKGGSTIKEGALRNAAARKGMSISQYCAQPNLSPLAKKRCALARGFAKMNKGKSRKS
jgi:hypothetical protein